MSKFTVPTGRNLSWIDAWLQNSKYEKSWEGSGVPDIFYQYANNGDWEDIEKSNNHAFMLAWHKTMSFMLNRDIDIENTDFEDF